MVNLVTTFLVIFFTFWIACVPTASSAEQKLIFIQKKGPLSTLYLTDVHKKKVVSLVTVPQWIQNPLPSPTGKWVAYEIKTASDLAPSLYLINLNQLEKPPIQIAAPSEKSHLLAWRDTEHLLITKQRDQGQRTLLAVNVKTLERKTIIDQGSSFYLSPDKKKVLIQLTAQDYRIGVVDSDGKNFQVLTSGGTEHAPSWSHSSTRIAYASNQGLWIYNLAQGKKRQISKQGENPFWLPQDESLLFEDLDQKNQRSLWMTDTAGKTTRNVTRGMQPALSPNHKWVLFHYSFDLGFFPRDGSWTHYLSYRGQHGAWSPDSRYIAYEQISRTADGSLGDAQILLYDLETKETKTITTAGHSFAPTWVPLP